MIAFGTARLWGRGLNLSLSGCTRNWVLMWRISPAFDALSRIKHLLPRLLSNKFPFIFYFYSLVSVQIAAMDRVNPQTGFDPAHPNIVQVPQFYFILKCVQVALSILILALSGASIGLLGGYYYSGGPGYSIFVVSRLNSKSRAALYGHENILTALPP